MANQKISQLTAVTTPLAGTEALPVVQSSATKKVTVAQLQAAPVAAQNANCLVYLDGSKVPSTNTKLQYNGAEKVSLNGGATPPVLEVFASSLSSEKGRMTSDTSGNVGLKLSTDYYDIELAPGVIGGSRNVKLTAGNLVIGTAGKGIDFSVTSQAGGMTSELLNDYEEGTWTPAVEGSTTPGTGTYNNQLGYYTKVGNLVHFQLWLQVTSHTGTGDIRITGLPYTSKNVFACGGGILTYAANLNFNANYVAQVQVAQNATYMNLLQYITGGGSGVTTIGIPIDTNMQVQISGTYQV